MDCEYELVCQNSSKCFKCYDQALLKLPKEKSHSFKSKEKDVRMAGSDRSWEDLEQRVADRLKKVPTAKETRRSRASGALWFEKGDIVDTILMPECKERKGSEIQQGADKSFSIKRSWLEKAKEEASENNRIMCLPFRFKNDEHIYNVMDFEDIAELVTMIKSYENTNAMLLAEIDVLKKKQAGQDR